MLILVNSRFNKLNLSLVDIMSFLKNPFNFIKKANNYFNLNYGNYKKFNEFLKEYNENQEKTEAVLSALIDVYVENQTKLDKFVERYAEDQKRTNNLLENLLENQEKNKAVLSTLLDIHTENQRKADDFIDSYNSIKDD